MVLHVKIDSREAALVQQFDTAFDFVIEPLDLGDVLIEDEENNIRLVFERKTLADLAASIKDGRYKEQKCRLLAAYPAKCITYIIEEGSLIPKDVCGLKKSVYSGIYVHSMFRDGVHVVFTKNLGETAAWIREVATKCKENPAKVGGGGGAAADDPYLHSRKAKSRKIENIDPQACYKLQLCQIPGVSYKVADAIIERYPTLVSLMAQMSAYETKAVAVKELSALPMIGAKKAAGIIAYLRPELEG